MFSLYTTSAVKSNHVVDSYRRCAAMKCGLADTFQTPFPQYFYSCVAKCQKDSLAKPQELYECPETTALTTIPVSIVCTPAPASKKRCFPSPCSAPLCTLLSHSAVSDQKCLCLFPCPWIAAALRYSYLGHTFRLSVVPSRWWHVLTVAAMVGFCISRPTSMLPLLRKGIRAWWVLLVVFR